MRSLSGHMITPISKQIVNCCTWFRPHLTLSVHVGRVCWARPECHCIAAVCELFPNNMIVLKYKYSTNKSTKYYISALWTVEVIDYCCFLGTSCECRRTSVSSSTFAALSVAVVCTSNVSSVICRCRLRVERFELRPWLVCASNVSSVICRCRLRVERFELRLWLVCTSNVSSVICRCRLRVERFELRPWLVSVVCASNVSSVICRCRLRVERFDLRLWPSSCVWNIWHRRVCVSASVWPAVCFVSDISISVYWYYVLFCSSEKYMLGHDKESTLEKIEHILKYNCYCYIVK